jgi:Zn-dependent peptidase ImmA (M78 family)/transcriptional regulator with XRE-family HTH domain
MMQAINTSNFIGERLAQAKKARGLTAVALADILGITSASISRYEHSKDNPKSDTLLAIAEKLNFPVSFFFQPIDKSINDRCIKWRSLASTTKFSRERGEARYEWMRNIINYLGFYFEFPRINIPDIALPSDFREYKSSDIDNAANLCREHWGIAQSPIKDLVLLLENNGVIVSRIAFGADKQDAFSEWGVGDFPFIFLGTDKNVCVRSRFDAAHELGHLILHKNVTNDSYKNPTLHKQLEGQANRFAAAFLMPKNEFFKGLWAPTLDAYLSLKSHWKVSIKGMIVHSHRHGILSDTQYQRMMINYVRRWKDGEPLDDELACEKPRLLTRCIESLISSGIKSKDDILRDLNLSQSDLEEMLGLRRGYFLQNESEVIQLQPKLKSINEFMTGNVMQFPKRGT